MTYWTKKTQERNACKCIYDKEAKKIFRSLLKKYPYAHIIWHDNHAELVIKTFSVIIDSRE